MRVRFQGGRLVMATMLAGTLALLGGAAGWADDKKAALPAPTPEQAEFFETKVRPLLSARCFSCHGDKSAAGGLKLNTLAAMLHGGGSGTALIPGDPDKSPIIKAVHYADPALKMPPTGRLPQAEIDTLTEWVKMGAPWPGAKPVPANLINANGEYMMSDAQKKWWSFQPVRKPALPKVKNTAWATSPIDRFLLAKMEAKGLTPAPRADRRTLIRRAYFDLIGLPPRPEDVDAFVADKSPNAWAKVVDRLLGDQRYGERWGRHWLDVARYADTKGYTFTEDSVYHNAYTYRDWVIRSFNEDLPYNQFVMQQLAADKMVTDADHRPLAALGYITLGRRFLNDPVLINDDRIDVTMRGLQGLTVGCARCHNHKFDPIPAKDYYSLYGIFSSSFEPAAQPVGDKATNDTYLAWQKRVADTQNATNGLIQGEIARLRKIAAQPAETRPANFPATLPAALQMFREGEPIPGNLKGQIEPVFTADAQAKLKSLRDSLADLQGHAPPIPPLAQTLADSDKPGDTRIFVRGNPGNQGDIAPRRFLLCLSGPDRKPFTQGSGRLELAQAIASPTNPLTARVFVNRVWLYHFGQGIVRTPSDFGLRGELPTHPELLDWLSSTFVESGWSVKKLHRAMMLSNAYQMSSDGTPRAFGLDSENRLLTHQNRQRLDLEGLRDSTLYASGRLDPKLGGPAVELTTAPYTTRRTVYGFINRQNLQGLYRTFDFASPDSSSAQRYRTTVPQQALFMMNAPFVLEAARALADRPEVKREASPTARIRTMYRLLFDRVPDAEELALGMRFVATPEGAKAAPTAPVWQYGWGWYDPAKQRVGEFTAFQHFTGTAWQGGGKLPDPKIGWAMLNAVGGHPGGDAHHAAIRRWTAPADATISVRGVLAHASDQGDGVRVTIVSSRQGVLGTTTAFHGETPLSLVDVVVKRGDTLDFVVDCQANENSDSFRFAPVIRTASPGGVKTVALEAPRAASREWNAESQFSGPQAPIPTLSAWERYAQALLMTNEFCFVD